MEQVVGSNPSSMSLPRFSKHCLSYKTSHYYDKGYFIIDQQIARHFVHYSNYPNHPLPFYTTNITNPFLTPRISAYHDKGLGFLRIGESLYSLMFL